MMNQAEKVEQLAKLMNELDVYVWQGVVYIGESTKKKGTFLVPSGSADEPRWTPVTK